ncbi:hypothetical protein M8818_005296 [Zalaria obscura]|uniref:Uncharacterized protein n=1 Tax=Zalaria obscura TaxID=2024903 RepID=A0ACC3SA21_9PEZI
MLPRIQVKVSDSVRRNPQGPNDDTAGKEKRSHADRNPTHNGHKRHNNERKKKKRAKQANDNPIPPSSFSPLIHEPSLDSLPMKGEDHLGSASASESEDEEQPRERHEGADRAFIETVRWDGVLSRYDGEGNGAAEGREANDGSPVHVLVALYLDEFTPFQYSVPRRASAWTVSHNTGSVGMAREAAYETGATWTNLLYSMMPGYCRVPDVV